MGNPNVFYASGRRKTAVAKVWIRPGNGGFVVNNKSVTDYFPQDTAQTTLLSPFILTDRNNEFDVKVKVIGGGVSGQAGAIRHGLSKALVLSDPELRGVLKSEGYITRDARKKERKKYGKRGARASYQFSKR